MKKTLLCMQCGKLLEAGAQVCPRCGAEIRPQQSVERREFPPFERLLEDPFEKIESIMERSYGERLEELYRRLCRLERELDDFL